MGCGTTKEGGNISIHDKLDSKKEEHSLSSNISYNNNAGNFYIKGHRTDEKEYYDDKEKINSENKTFIQIMYQKHLEFREMHGCSKNEFEKDEELSQMAQDYVNNLIKNENKNDFLFSNYTYNNDILGENIYISNVQLSPDKICEIWYNEINNYNYDEKKFQKNTSHFTQLIWKNTKKVGFGLAVKRNITCVVAFYYPAGNIFSEFDKNVGKKIY